MHLNSKFADVMAAGSIFKKDPLSSFRNTGNCRFGEDGFEFEIFSSIKYNLLRSPDSKLSPHLGPSHIKRRRSRGRLAAMEVESEFLFDKALEVRKCIISTQYAHRIMCCSSFVSLFITTVYLSFVGMV